MKIAYLGTGTWGFCLASLLASKGHEVVSWSTKAELVSKLSKGEEHPLLRGHIPLPNMGFTENLSEALSGAELIVESVTSAGIRPVFQQVKQVMPQLNCPVVITSKGIEQGSGKILADVIEEIYSSAHELVSALSGPGYAQEVIKGLPTSVVASAHSPEVLKLVCETFTTDSFRVYPNTDMLGVAYGGALKNIIAIACGISDGLALGNSAKATLMTRGLHEIRKLAIAKGSKPETLNGLSGMGDICLTCSSLMSRNFRYGYLLAQGRSPEKAQDEIGTVVEGLYTCLSALQLSQELDVAMPITEAVYNIVYKQLDVKKAVSLLMQRTIKEEHL